MSAHPDYLDDRAAGAVLAFAAARGHRPRAVAAASTSERMLAWWASPADSPQRHAARIALFVSEMQAWPKIGSSDLTERELASYLAVARAQRAHPAADVLDDIAPGWRAGEDDPWEQAAVRVARWIGEHGRMPRRRAQELPERSYGAWLRSQRVDATRRRLDVRRGHRLDALLPGWRDAQAGRA